jgi:hypothetical protein
MADNARIKAVGGPFDGGEVEDLGTTHQWIDAGGWAYHEPGDGRVLYFRNRGVMKLVSPHHAEIALIVLDDIERARKHYYSNPANVLPFSEYVEALEVLASVARGDD